MVTLGAEGAKSEDDVGGGRMPESGLYHVVIPSVDESFDEVDKIVIEFRVLAGNKDGQVGRSIKEYFAVSEKALPRLKRLALCVDLLKPNEPEKDVEFVAAIGRQLVIEVEDHEYEKGGETKKTRRVTFCGMWSVGNKEVAKVPKDAQALKLVSGQTTPAPPAPNTQSLPPAPPPLESETAAEPPSTARPTDKEWAEFES